MNDDNELHVRGMHTGPISTRTRRNVFRWGRAWVPDGVVGCPDDGNSRVHHGVEEWFVKCHMRHCHS